MKKGQDRSTMMTHSGIMKTTMPTASMMAFVRLLSRAETKSMRTWPLCRKT